MFRDDSGAYVAIYRDVTDRNRSRLKARSLEFVNAELRSFAHAASHDLKEPLRTMNSFSGLLMRRYQDQLDPEAQEYLAMIGTSAKRGITLVEDLLNYSEVSYEEVERERVSTNQVAHTVKASLHSELKARGAEVVLHELPPVYATETWVRQLLQNLISNGVKFSRPGTPPRVEVFGEETEDYTHIAVRDNGIGIEDGASEQVFGIFRRLVDRAEYEGSGVGLAVCQRIAERLGACLTYESEVGKGTTFHLRFPKLPTMGVEATVTTAPAIETQKAPTSPAYAKT